MSIKQRGSVHAAEDDFDDNMSSLEGRSLRQYWMSPGGAQEKLKAQQTLLAADQTSDLQ
jgi:hypothetical protein